MNEIYEMFWVVLAVIGITAVCKVTYKVYRGRSSDSHSNNVTHVSSNQRRSQNETGSMVYYADNPHRRSDCEYRFNYKKVGGSWRAYILRMPSLCGRDGNLHKTHRFTDGHGAYWVCWDSPVNSLKDMQAISRVWANSIQEYIATGKRFG